ncbi:HNH endonuclease [Agrococcus sp. SGAir0287]|uniref:HNH endonuclease n=1 Tax=Agrococcus sp. SGAir0287 TaxID=2070347 RepID=UPI001586107B|nr:HNH endonuclease [Agrococcus sp. SGAir0287]
MVDWIYDEIVLAADVVSRNGWKSVRSNSKEAKALSALLRRGALHAGADLPANFRSVASIQRKTADLETARPGYQGKATRGNRLDRIVIVQFEQDPTGMQQRASMIRRLLEEGEELPMSVGDADDYGDEGGLVEFVGRRRERDPKLRSRKLDAVEASGLPIACEVCSFDFGERYGSRGKGYIEVHHRHPLHVTGATRTHLDELALLCANCHRMCHRGDWITPDSLRAIMHAEVASRSAP